MGDIQSIKRDVLYHLSCDLRWISGEYWPLWLALEAGGHRFPGRMPVCDIQAAPKDQRMDALLKLRQWISQDGFMMRNAVAEPS